MRKGVGAFDEGDQKRGGSEKKVKAREEVEELSKMVMGIRQRRRKRGRGSVG